MCAPARCHRCLAIELPVLNAQVHWNHVDDQVGVIVGLKPRDAVARLLLCEEGTQLPVALAVLVVLLDRVDQFWFPVALREQHHWAAPSPEVQATDPNTD